MTDFTGVLVFFGLCAVAKAINGLAKAVRDTRNG